MTYENQFAALSHPIRQQILNSLQLKPASVRALTDQLSASQPVISQHLKVLRDAGLVRSTPDGKKNIYQIEDAGMNKLRTFLENHWLSTLNSLSDNGDQT